jgi:hypothetical protein
MEFMVVSSSPIKNLFQGLQFNLPPPAPAWRRHFAIGGNGPDFREKRIAMPRWFSRGPLLAVIFNRRQKIFP